MRLQLLGALLHRGSFFCRESAGLPVDLDALRVGLPSFLLRAHRTLPLSIPVVTPQRFPRRSVRHHHAPHSGFALQLRTSGRLQPSAVVGRLEARVGDHACAHATGGFKSRDCSPGQAPLTRHVLPPFSGHGVEVWNLLPSCLHMSWTAWRPDMAADGTLPPGMTHCPAI